MMITKGLCFLLSAMVALTSAQKFKPNVPRFMYTPTHPTADNSTYANIDYAVATHMHLDWENITFFNGEANATQIFGSVSTDFDIIQDTDVIVVDAWNLNITSATQGIGLAKTATEQGKRYKDVHGDNNVLRQLSGVLWHDETSPNSTYSAYIIKLPFTYPAGSVVTITIVYSTESDAEAIGWLNPGQAGESGQNCNYVYSQSEDVNGRSMIPMQDTPAIRVTYGSCIVVETGYNVFMSANRTSFVNLPDYPGFEQVCFQQSNKVVPYQIAFVMGNFSMFPMDSTNTTVLFAPPSLMNSAKIEFASLPTMFNLTQQYVGVNYPYSQYFLVVMPTAYPFAGMANPMLNLISATTIVGDKSQLYVVLNNLAQ